MLIVISQRQDKNKHGSYVDNLDASYIKYFGKFGARLLPIPNYSKYVKYYFKELPIKGIILSSGNDINQALYSSKEKSPNASVERDTTEKEILKISIKNKLPVLGLCRGMQFINVFFGGKLIVANQNNKNKIKHVASVHKIRITNERAEKLIGSNIEVNSFHNWGISKDSLSKDIISFAESEEGFIEGIYHPKLPIAGIMWHPERKSPNEIVNKKIIELFLERKLFWGS